MGLFLCEGLIRGFRKQGVWKYFHDWRFDMENIEKVVSVKLGRLGVDPRDG
jgi:hypothetical protein